MKFTVVELCLEAVWLGLILEKRGDKLAVTPKGRCTESFKRILKNNKPEIMRFLELRNN